MRSLDFLRLCLDEDPTGDRLGDAVRELVKQRTPEDVHLDYKDGALAQKDRFDAADLRRDVSAFTNADGGVIVYGVGEEKQSGGHALPVYPPAGTTVSAEEFGLRVEHALRPLSPMLYPLPKVLSATTIGGAVVLVLAVRRSERLVPVIENGHAKFYLRIGEGRYPMPEYLHADLEIGRRRRVALEVNIGVKPALPNDRNLRAFEVWVSVTNVGLDWFPEAQLGHIGFGCRAEGSSHGTVRSKVLRDGILTPPPDPQPLMSEVVLHQRRTSLGTLAPFESREVRSDLHVQLPVVAGVARPEVFWAGFVYLAPQGEPPRRYQMAFRYREANNELLGPVVSRPLADGEAPICWWGSTAPGQLALSESPELSALLQSTWDQPIPR